MKHFRYAVVIMRAQPFHNQHKKLVDRALEVADNVIIVLGSHGIPRTARNPFFVGDHRTLRRRE